MKTEMDFSCRHVRQTQTDQINYEVQTEWNKKEQRQLCRRCKIGTTDGPFVSQYPLNALFMKSSVNMGYGLKDRRSILGNGRVFICCCFVRPHSADHPTVVPAVNLCTDFTLIEAQKPYICFSISCVRNLMAWNTQKFTFARYPKWFMKAL
jgi:hypothetical protein